MNCSESIEGYRRAAVIFVLLGLAWGPIGCSREPTIEALRSPDSVESQRDLDPRRPRYAVVESLRADLAAKRHPADGSGSATLEILAVGSGAADAPGAKIAEGNELRAGGLGRFLLTWTAGPLGLAEGGALYLQVSPFWGWSTPQVENPEAPGFTVVTTDAQGVSLRTETLDRQLLVAHVEGRSLEVGETIHLRYGAGPALARVDRFAEAEERVWLAVDGDGDGVRGLLIDPPTVEIGPGPAARLVAFLPSTARPKTSVNLHVSLLDRWGNAGIRADGVIRIEGQESEPIEHFMSLQDDGTVIVPWTTGEPGLEQLVVTFSGDEHGRSAPPPQTLRVESNPMWVAESPSPIFWGDLQVHSNRSDGTGLPADLYVYGRDVARLDVMSVTDHDHWGLRFLDQDEDGWQGIQSVTEDFHQPSRFVTVRGFEWTNWIHGHRHVLVFDDLPLPMFSSLDEACDHPQELWDALRGRQALTIAHHSAGGPIAIDWTIEPDPVLEPVTEVVSVHGSSEAEDSPRVIHQPVAGNFVRQAALGRGFRLGLIGSTDGHDGHPGLAHLAGPSGGLVAILAEDLTRPGVLDALRRRRAYATSGPRVILRALLAGFRMGAEIPVAGGRAQSGSGSLPGHGDQSLWVYAAAPVELERIDIIEPGSVESVPCGQKTCSFSLQLDSLTSGGFLYLRAVQRDSHFAISSPFFFVEAEP